MGFAVFQQAADPLPLFGTWKIPKVYDPDDIGSRTLALRRWLRDMISVHKPECVVFESPFIPLERRNDNTGFVTTAQVLRRQLSLASEAETTAMECGVRHVLECATSSAKVALAGTARLGKEKKKAMLIAATRKGWRCSNDHEADAGAVALVAYQHFGMEAA